MTLLVHAGGFFIHRRGQRDAVLSDPPGGAARHLPGGQQRLTVAAVGLEGHRHICRDTAGITRAERSRFVVDESYTDASSGGRELKLGARGEKKHNSAD